MNTKHKRALLISIFSLTIVLTMISYMYSQLFVLRPNITKTTHLYIDPNDNIDSIYAKLKTKGNLKNINGFKWMTTLKSYDKYIKTGKYAILPNENILTIFNHLYRGQQTPTNITISSLRTIDQLISSISKQIMIDSTEIAKIFNDSTIYTKDGFNKETLPTLFIPNTYQVYWNITAKDLYNRLYKEYRLFWNEERKSKAKKLAMTPTEITTLASIIEEETKNKQEKPIVAGLYINRLRKNIPLQADPTIKFALQDFTLRRIINSHLTIKSPYNTYINPGLPPGPIRITPPDAIDAVLNYRKHDYIYMCAKEDFSGTHNFATTLSEHMQNARKYWNALNKKKIYK